MKKFLVLYRMDMAAMKKMMETSSKEDQQKGMKEWGDWMQAHAANFADMGAPTGKNTEMGANGAVEKSNDIGGYSILQAESKDAAVAILKGNPHFKMPGATVDVAEIVSMGM
jgi:hypothetical protein